MTIAMKDVNGDNDGNEKNVDDASLNFSFFDSPV